MFKRILKGVEASFLLLVIGRHGFGIKTRLERIFIGCRHSLVYTIFRVFWWLYGSVRVINGTTVG